MSSHAIENTPHSVYEACGEDGPTLADLRRVLPDHLKQVRPGLAWLTLLRVVATIALFPLILSQLRLEWGPALAWQLPAHLLAWLFYGWALVGLFVLGHDCGHGSFARSPRVNRFVGHLCMAPLINSLHTWVLTHDHHHARTQLRGQEVDWASHLRTREEFAETSWRREPMVRLGYALPYGILLWILWNTVRRGFTVRTQLPADQFQRERGRLAWSNSLMFASAIAIYGGLWAFGGVWAMFKFYAIPATVAMWTGALLITIHHANPEALFFTKESWTPVRGQMVSTFDVRFPRLLEWMWCYINVHIPHHVSIQVPWYHLPEAARTMESQYPRCYQRQKFSLGHLSWFARTPFLSRDPSRDLWSPEPAAC